MKITIFAIMNILSPQPINGHRIASDISKYKGAFVL
jgi:hypothetical protein